MKQIMINPGYVEATEIYEVTLTRGSFEYKRLLSQDGLPLDMIAKFLEPYKHIAMFIDPASPEVADALRNEGFWILK